MLGYLIADPARGQTGRLLFDLSQRLQADGWALAGAVQRNDPVADGTDCEMDLHLLGQDRVVRISQDLGPGAAGCRLDPGAMAEAVALASAALARIAAGAPGRRLCIVNKFGKVEAEGQGFRPLIAEALGAGIPVLTSVTPVYRPAFEAFVADMAAPLPEGATLNAVLEWCAALD